MAFKSGFERTVNANLLSRNVKFTYETLELPYILEGKYHPDFILDNGIVVEVKGVLDKESKRKMVAVKKYHPEVDLRFLFMDASKKIPGTKQSHGEWATKNGFPWAEGTVPSEWLTKSSS